VWFLSVCVVCCFVCFWFACGVGLCEVCGLFVCVECWFVFLCVWNFGVCFFVFLECCYVVSVCVCWCVIVDFVCVCL